MSKRCEICKRGPKKSIQRSHSNHATKRKQYLNLQEKVINGKRTQICTRCIKTLNKKNK